MLHFTIAKTSTVGMSGGKPKIILAARQCGLFCMIYPTPDGHRVRNGGLDNLYVKGLAQMAGQKLGLLQEAQFCLQRF